VVFPSTSVRKGDMNVDLDRQAKLFPASKSAVPQSTKPPTNMWCPGALLCAYLGGIRYYGRITYTDGYVDYIVVQAYSFTPNLPLVAAWAGTRSELKDIWSFAHHQGAA
jgi:hypothetical protein